MDGKFCVIVGIFINVRIHKTRHIIINLPLVITVQFLSPLTSIESRLRLVKKILVELHLLNLWILRPILLSGWKE